MATNPAVISLEDLDPQCPPAVPLEHLVQGYPRLAGRMGLIPETAIFRRFSALNIRNLLYLQAELMNLEMELQKQELEDKASGHEFKQNFSRDWYKVTSPDPASEHYQWSLILNIREKLKQYSKWHSTRVWDCH